jgi:two-component system CheB/CheR fusion protein
MSTVPTDQRVEISSPPRLEAANSSLMVVGIGASAGGLKALQQFVDGVSKDSGMAYVVIVHLDPDRESRMAELLQDRSDIPVTQVIGETVVEANHIYIIPPGRDLTMRGSTIALQDRGERAEHAPIDLFFRTLAEVYGQDAVGVVLSGTGSDGTAGIRDIREAGGITVAQSPDDAEYNGMPSSAIATGLIDLVLPSTRIAAELVRLRRLPASVGNGPAAKADRASWLPEIFATLQHRTGHDFSLYKESTVRRRLDRRMRFHAVSTLEEYLPLLQGSGAEYQALLRDLLISVSSFFRDPEAFEALAALIPTLFDGKGPADAVRVWIVGCATGEEVYSIAMILSEHASALRDPPRIQMFATDIDEKGYERGRAGLYPATAVASVPQDRLRRFFTKEVGGYRIAKSLREMVLFANHNVLHDPPFSRIDLISCRNLFIYLQPEAQERALETFHFATNPDGLLFLGASETAGEGGLFVATAQSGRRLYRRSDVPNRVMPRLSTADPVARIGSPALARVATDQSVQPFSYGALHLQMLEQYAPASAVVDEDLNCVHLSAGAGRYLRLGEGAPSHNLMALATGDLRRVLRTGLHHAFKDRTQTSRRIWMPVDGEKRQVRVDVRPPPMDGNSSKYALLVFELEATSRAAAAQILERGQVESQPEEIEVEAELRRMRELLETTGASHDRTVAELQAVNEELQSVIEEQKAASQELETGREEIQSINEELTTINQEHQSTIEELKRTNADLQNLIESTEIGTIFLDRAMRLRRFTPSVVALFNFVPEDQGRPLSHITHRLLYDSLPEDVASVLQTLKRIEREVDSDSGESYIVRINPYRSLDGGNDGAVLTFFNETAQHRVREELRDATIAAEAANLAKGTFLATLSHEFRTPLNAIIGYADILQLDRTLTEEQGAKVERIKAGGWHLVTMIEEILSFSRLDGGQSVGAFTRVDANDIAREARSLVLPAATAKRLEIDLDVSDGAVDLETDAGKARQILVNLCENAVKYTAKGTVTLGVHGEADHIVFEVRDTGIGIAAEHHAQIFERFWQVDGASTRAAGGLGIGLAAAREYARLLGGGVDVESEPGTGSTFRVWLPREQPHPEPPVTA